MRILDRSVYVGPSLYAHFPVIRLELDLGHLEVHELLVAVRHLARPDDALHEPGLVERVKAEMAAASSAPAELAPLAA